MMRPAGVLAVVALGVAFGLQAAAQEPAKAPAYAVISVKRCAPDEKGYPYQQMPDGISEQNNTALWLLGVAYGIIDPSRILGAPKWAEEERYNVDAKVDEADVAALAGMTPKQRNAMLVQVMQERFGVKAHYETRVFDEYGLVVGKKGLRPGALTPAAPGETKPSWKYTGSYNLAAKNTSMKQFVVYPLSTEAQKMVEDRTGLTRLYDFKLSWSRVDMGASPGGVAGEGSSPDIFKAVREQLGLEMVPIKAEGQVLVVEHMERPAAN